MPEAIVPEVVGASTVPAVVKKESTELDRPSFVSKGHRGTENVETKDVTMPRLVLTQANTPNRKKSSPTYIEKLEEGDYFNSLTQERYGPSLKITPVLFYKSRIYFKDIAEGGGILCQAPDNKSGPLSPQGCDKCPHSQWPTDGKSKKPACTELYNFVSILPENRELIVVSFKGSGIKAAKRLNSLIRFKNADSFAGVYQLTSAAERANDQDYFAPRVDNCGWVDEDTYRYAEQAYEALSAAIKAKPLSVDMTGMEGEEDTSFPYGANGSEM